MRLQSLLLLACLMPAFGCARTITIGKDPEADPAVDKSAVAKRYRVSFPDTDLVYVPMFYDMLQAVDEGVGYEMLILPAPLYEATTDFRWFHTDGKTKPDELCVAHASETPDPAWGAFKIELSLEYAKGFWNSKSPLKDTRLYKVFLHCMGHAMGFEDDSNHTTDLMNPDFSDTADVAAFHARLRQFNHPAP